MCLIASKSSGVTNAIFSETQMWDLYSDLNLTQSIWRTALDSENRNDKEWLVIAILTGFFVVIPYCANMAYSLRLPNELKQKASHNTHAKQYFRNQSRFVAFLVLFSGGMYPVLRFVNSRVCGLSHLCMGLTKTELRKFASVRGMSVGKWESTHIV